MTQGRGYIRRWGSFSSLSITPLVERTVTSNATDWRKAWRDVTSVRLSVRPALVLRAFSHQMQLPMGFYPPNVESKSGLISPIPSFLFLFFFSFTLSFIRCFSTSFPFPFFIPFLFHLPLPFFLLFFSFGGLWCILSKNQRFWWYQLNTPIGIWTKVLAAIDPATTTEQLTALMGVSARFTMTSRWRHAWAPQPSQKSKRTENRW